MSANNSFSNLSYYRTTYLLQSKIKSFLSYISFIQGQRQKKVRISSEEDVNENDVTTGLKTCAKEPGENGNEANNDQHATAP